MKAKISHLVSIFVLVTAIVATTACGAASATTINGSLNFLPGSTNYFDPANGFVPPGFGNSISPIGVSVGPGIEFGFQQQLGFLSTTITADFTTTAYVGVLTIRNNYSPANVAPWEMVFTASTPGFFDGLAYVINTFSPSLTFTLLGDTLTVDWAGGALPDGASFEGDFKFSGGPAAVVPLPAALPLFATGLGALGLLGWRRKRKNPA